MLKIKIIDPKSHLTFRSTINAFLHLLKQYHNVILTPELQEKATFAIGIYETAPSGDKPPEWKLYGGAVFYPQKISRALNLLSNDNSEETLDKISSTIQSHGLAHWIARIALIQDNDEAALLLQKLTRRHVFYEQLHKTVLKFGKAKKIKGLAFVLRTPDTLDMSSYKYWPSLLEFKLPHKSDGYFYGLLSLKKRSFTASKKEKQLKSFDPQTNDSPLSASDRGADANGRQS